MPIVDPKGQEDFFLNGESFVGLKPKGGVKTELEDYWLNGESFRYIIPSGDTDFMPFFWSF
jgi:hypothetical protein